MALTLPTPTAKAPAKPRLCIVTRASHALDPDEQAQLAAWLADDTIAAWRIGAAIDAGSTAVKDHRGQRCSCYRGKP